MLRKLWVKDFRNLKEQTLTFEGHDPIVIVGKNNQGKSNFLESIYMLGHGACPNDDLVYVVNNQAQAAYVGGDVVCVDSDKRVYIKVDLDGKKQIQINQDTYKTARPLASVFNVDYVSADIIRLFKESPDKRRSELNRFGSNYSDTYQRTLKQYERIVRQKNQLLKTDVAYEDIIVWNTALVTQATQLVQERKRLLDLLILKMADLLSLSGLPVSTALSASYVVNRFPEDASPDYQEWLTQKLQDNFYKEKAAGYGLYGPQRDDFDILVDGQSLFHFFSRGINRAMAIIWRVAQLDLFQEQQSRFPVLCLDDTFAEIDDEIKQGLIGLIQSKTQVFYTTINKEDQRLFRNPACFEMVGGALHG